MAKVQSVPNRKTREPATPELRAIEELMLAQNKSRADLGRLLGLDSAQVTRIFAGTRKIQRHEMAEVERWLGLRSDASPSATILPGPGMVPLYGLVGASSESRLTLAVENLLGHVPIHPAQVMLREPFALQVADVSMTPRYEPGEVVYLAPHQRPRPGQDVVIVMKDGSGHLKRFVRLAEHQVVCAQFNPAQEVCFDRAEVDAMHAVVGRG